MRELRINIPEPVGESARARVVHNAMWLAYVYEGLSAADTAAQLSRELKVKETRGSVLSYAHRQGWAKAQINATPCYVTAHPEVALVAPRVANPGRKLSELPILPAEKRPDRRRPAPAAPFVAPVAPEPVVDLSMMLPKRATVFGPVRPVDLNHQHCKWPIGDPDEDSFRHCGDRRLPGGPYCETHMRKAYTNSKR